MICFWNFFIHYLLPASIEEMLASRTAYGIHIFCTSASEKKNTCVVVLDQ